jgi:glycosyltransferase involved in cell wall biosynthesis
LCKQRPDVRFIFAGRNLDRKNPAIGNLVRDLGISDRCHLLGERSDIAAIYRTFDVFLSTSLSEGLPNCIGEAMATAVPCAATDVGDTRDLIGNTGLVFPPHDIDAATAACVDLIGRTQVERDQLGNAARQRIESMYAIKAESSAYARLYRELAELRKR